MRGFITSLEKGLKDAFKTETDEEARRYMFPQNLRLTG